MTYRAAYWTDGQASVVLTGREHADLSDEDLIAEARAGLARQGGTEDGGRIVVGEWRG